MWNPFKKSTGSNQMGMLQRIAMKKMMNMSPEERNKLTQDMLKPENKDKLLQAMEMMKKSGQVTDEQIEDAKKKLGL